MLGRKRVMDEADALVVAAAGAALRAVEVRQQILLAAAMIEAQTAAECDQIDATMMAAAGIAAMRGHLLAERQHLADAVYGERIGDLGEAKHPGEIGA